MFYWKFLLYLWSLFKFIGFLSDLFQSSLVPKPNSFTVISLARLLLSILAADHRSLPSRINNKPSRQQRAKSCFLLTNTAFALLCSACESKNPPWGQLTFFPERLGMFSPNVTRLLCVPINARLQVFIPLTATLTKLCHDKRDHPVHIVCSKICPSSGPKRTLGGRRLRVGPRPGRCHGP